MDVAQLVRLPNKTRRSCIQPPPFHVTSCLWHYPPSKAASLDRGRFLWITFMKCSNYVRGMLQWDDVLAPMLLRRSGILSRGQGIEVGDGRDESREFGRPRILLRLSARLVVEEKGVNRGFQIYSEVQEGRHGIHYEYESGMVALSGQPWNQFSQWFGKGLTYCNRASDKDEWWQYCDGEAKQSHLSQTEGHLSEDGQFAPCSDL